jgi:hypothetical protein
VPVGASRSLAQANRGPLDYRDAGAQGACFVLRLPTATTATTSASQNRFSSIGER